MPPDVSFYEGRAVKIREVSYRSTRDGFSTADTLAPPRLSLDALNQVRALATQLPSGLHHLPPDERRVVVQLRVGKNTDVRFYDRANLPKELIEILRLGAMGKSLPVTPYIPEFQLTSSFVQPTNLLGFFETPAPQSRR